ncbi:hypothetical protein BGW42_007244 [Actinomortierella wolfii]|nr:hypothetical protein BGW42_007244 [Actinomortierella wolfii]
MTVETAQRSAGSALKKATNLTTVNKFQGMFDVAATVRPMVMFSQDAIRNVASATLKTIIATIHMSSGF